MAVISITDLPRNSVLDRKAMSLVRGAGGGWVHGSFRPFVAPTPSFGSVTNFFQVDQTFVENNFYNIDNSIHVDKLVNQFQTIQISNSGSNSPITALPIGFATA